MIKKYWLVGFILLFPIAGYLLLSTGKNHFRSLPYFGPKSLSGKFKLVRGKSIPDTNYYKVPNFSLINQDNQLVKFNTLDSNLIWVINFFYSRGNNIDPIIQKSMDSLVRQFRIHEDVRFLSISLDPVFDSPLVLNKYAKSIGADTRRWSFLTGKGTETRQIARNSFFVNTSYNSADSVTAHSPMLILLDPMHRIRGYYDGTREEDQKKLRDEIIVLRYEVMRKVTDLIQH